MRKETIEKYKACLIDLSNRQRGINSLGKVFRKHGISMGAGKVLQREQLISKDEEGFWRWNSGAELNKSEWSEMAATVLGKVNADVMGKASPKKSKCKITAKHKTAENANGSIKIDIKSLEKEKAHLHERIAKIDEIIDTAKQLEALLN